MQQRTEPIPLKPIIQPTPIGEEDYYVYTLSYPEGVCADDGQDLGGHCVLRW